MLRRGRLDLKIALAYLRVSTDRQTVDNQKMFLERWATDSGYSIARFYMDPGVSGTVPALQRQEFMAMMKYLKYNHVDAVLVFELSRIGRNFWDTLEVIKAVDAYAPLLACSPKETFLQTADPGMRKLLLAIFSWVAEMERGNIVERTKAGLARAKAQGRVGGRKPKALDWQLFEELTRQGLKLSEIAPRLGVTYPTLVIHIKRRLRGVRQ
jgi:putative DNA-invertase from lambdoid prophage Rac